MKSKDCFAFPLLLLGVVPLMGQEPVPRASGPQPVIVRTGEQFGRALNRAAPGTRILLMPGVYSGNIYVDGPRGSPDLPIVIAAADPQRKPIIRGGKECIKLTSPAHVELKNLILEGSSSNGLNIDDGGSKQASAHHVTLQGLVVRNTGYNGIKMAGVDQFTFRDLVSCCGGPTMLRVGSTWSAAMRA
jgi:hypothetical protein